MIKKIQDMCQQKLIVGNQSFNIINPRLLSTKGISIKEFPFSIIILLEQIIRNLDDKKFLGRDVENLSQWNPQHSSDQEIPFMPSRVVLQDFTGVPSLVDLAALRNALVKRNIDPLKINPAIPVDLIIDHSVQVDKYGDKNALNFNNQLEFERNAERYKFLKWGQNSFKNFRVFPPGAGIIHQINLEFLSPLTHLKDGYCYADTLVGTDSHTTMINGLGVLGWGAGGIEAESAMLNQPIFMKIPDVVGFELRGAPHKDVTATDLVLTITEMLRKKGVVEKFVEFFGSGLDNIALADRATIANMAPEYGATMGYFPVDAETMKYLAKTGRDQKTIERAEKYFKALNIFRDKNTVKPQFSSVLSLNLADVEPSIAGPKRPQDRVLLSKAQETWQKSLVAPVNQRGFNLDNNQLSKPSKVPSLNQSIDHGSVIIAAITSCTNTSNPSLMITAGLLAKKAYQAGLQTKPWVKTSLAPGSRVVSDYLEKTGLQTYLDKLGFFTVGYGCTTCIGNSGPINADIEKTIKDNNLIVCSVLSGNRNFEGRIHVSIKANYLASPPLVVAYALSGTINIDLTTQPVGIDKNGKNIFLQDIWPSKEEIKELLDQVTPDLYLNSYQNIQQVSSFWQNIKGQQSTVYDWDTQSTYIQRPPFFDDLHEEPLPLKDITSARALLKLGDSITTDHISPAGAFSEDSPAGSYLLSKGVARSSFNTYGARRGNDKVMSRGTFANVRIRNQIAPETEGGFTKLLPDNKVMTVYEAANIYRQRNIPTIVIAGAEYGSGSSRDWAAKGPYLLGIKAIVATSFERIHRSNLIGMGVLPLQFIDQQTHETLGITGNEEFSICGLHDGLKPGTKLVLKADDRSIPVLCRLDTEIEVEYYRNGGILHTVLLDIIKSTKNNS